MTTMDGYLTAKDLMNFHYCKRLIYFENVLKIKQATTTKELKGRALHNSFSVSSKRTKIIKEFPYWPKIYNLRLKSDFLHLITTLDCLIINQTDNEAFPLEYKYSKKPRKIYKTMKLQLSLQALLVNELLHYSVKFGFIKFSKDNSLAKVSITDRDLEEVRTTISEVNTIVEKEILPPPTEYKKRCIDCCYFNICKGI
ncbi:CRISPR-associated protein Cas4 [Candidatus Micrarchaeota archaeon]|nr:MAG: CRISPR-associated protein Cas4 [Candidatus Micrarchaeota archaeon]